MFESEEYQNIIDKINKIRSYGLNKMITIPQIAILGDQSSGKSSVLEAITKLSFPRNIDTCTRFATQVSLRQSERAGLSAHIDDEHDFNKKYNAMEATANINPIINEANRILCSRVEISDKVLEITISGPTLSPLTVIDLPGYINTTVDGQDKSIVETIRTINTRYIKDSRTIILAVVPANVDLNNIFVLGEAERYDPSNERTIPIVTKPDTVEDDLLPSLVETILNKRKFMRLGYLVMKNSSFRDIELPWDTARLKEEEFFNSSPLWAQVPESRKGRASVEKFLGRLLVDHIKKELPQLKLEVLALIGVCEKEIAVLGPPVSNLTSAKQKYLSSIMNLKSSLTELLDGRYTLEYINAQKAETTAEPNPVLDEDDDSNDLSVPALTTDQGFIRSGLYKRYENFSNALNKDKFILSKDKVTELVIRYKGNELPGFISFTTFTQIYTQTLSHWHDITKVRVLDMHRYFFKAVSDYIAFTSDPLLKNVLQLEFAKFYSSQIIKIDDVVENIFTDEGSPFTMNKYYFDTIMKKRQEKAEKKQREQLDKWKGHIEQATLGTKVLNSTNYANCLNTLKIEDWTVSENEKHAVEDLTDELLSYCKVARKRIVDVVVLQSIERYMIKQINLYFDLLIAVDDNTISSMLLESPSKIAQRDEIQNRLHVLQKSLLEL
ncbi:hypothetical protein EMPS_00775 [Entomortierella parvispora]|uniref:Dynamin-type G domain-containing protein n=1 Tax=Entomortierella parvispora TaxID=205924 RepID=A0A9P3H1M5_9FUNG|nr:hypothetical protein EMPS_00775 [Entomortierella parvispora]